MVDENFAKTVGFYLGMYIRAQNVREKISWLWGALSMVSKALKDQLSEEELERLEQYDKELDDIFLNHNWELFDNYRFGNHDALTEDEYDASIEALCRLEHIKNDLLQMLYKTNSLIQPYILGSENAP